ncbi:MAG: hypothetical protein DI535_16690 [Citrobacter freundii]|nr:MAG: hypothetical protein DI535_16690 [Citrobacter freundii]
MFNINDAYFDGYYKEIWRAIIPEALTRDEVSFFIEHFSLTQSSKVLDLMCGYGRHSIELARKGIVTTAVDNLLSYIEEVKLIANQENLPVKTFHSDILSFEDDQKYDLTICMGNSLNFFNEDDTIKILSSVNKRLQTGGYLVINTWSLTEIAVKTFQQKTWGLVDGVKFLSDCKYLFFPARIESECTMIFPDNHAEIKRGVDYIFSIAEFQKMLEYCGFAIQEIFSIPGRKKFALGDQRAYLVAKKAT